MYLTRTPPWFSFIVHPREPAELDSMSGASLLRRYSKDEDEFVRKACSSPALVLGQVTMRGSSIRGEVVGAVRMPRTMLTREGMRAVVEAAQLAASRGSAVVGLGALTAPVTAGGSLLLRHLPGGVTITNGNALTAVVAKENVMEAVAAHEAAVPRVAVLGAAGSVGAAASELIAAEGLDLILIGRSSESLRKHCGHLRATLSEDVSSVADVAVVLVLTSDLSARLLPGMLKPGTIVVDLAQPANVPSANYLEFRRAGISVAEGGIVRIPGFRCTQDFFLEDAEDAFACLAETYLMATTGLRDHSVGHVNPDFARRMSSLAIQHGIRPRPLRLKNSDDSMTPENLGRISTCTN